MGGSSSPLLDDKVRRRSRISLTSPAERPIHLYASRFTGNNVEAGRTAGEAVLSFPAEQGRRDARSGEIVERAPQSRGRIERV